MEELEVEIIIIIIAKEKIAKVPKKLKKAKVKVLRDDE